MLFGKAVEKFQFQTGSIKSKLNIELSELEGSFNSKLVRLKGWLCIHSLRMSISCFNSKLVRLKVQDSVTVTKVIQVSIPNWFD